MEIKFYYCKHCGNIIAFAHSSGVPVVCCGEKMSELLPNSVDAAAEKHVPVATKDGAHITVEVGSVAHPMTNEHYISFICLQTDKGNQRKVLAPNDAPKAEFYLCEGEKAQAAYAYCNKHGLWKTEL